PMVEDDGWFFDTELLVLAEHTGLRIHEVPVDWVDDPDSRVDVRSTAVADLRGVRRLMRRRYWTARPRVPARWTTPSALSGSNGGSRSSPSSGPWPRTTPPPTTS